MGVQHSFVSTWDKQAKTVIPALKHSSKPNRDEAIALYNKCFNHGIPSIEEFNTIITEAAKTFNARPNVVNIQPKPDQKIIVVGDLHGCFQAVIQMFTRIGFPGRDETTGTDLIYLFNGDLVDRGGSAYQIVYVLSLFAVACPNHMFINRGNHESESFGMCTKRSGFNSRFMFEIEGKFPALYNRFEVFKPAVLRLFTSLQIAHSIPGGTFICHGGVPKHLELPEHVGEPASPYPIADLLSRDRHVDNFMDSPINPDEQWHNFVWSYDRNEDTARFASFNGYRTVVNSHTAVCFHNVRAFRRQPVSTKPGGDFKVLHMAMSREEYSRRRSEMKTTDDDTYFVVEIFTSPSNGGDYYVVELTPDSTGVVDSNPYTWNFEYMGTATDYQFVGTDE
eukprot:gnl/Dysnectes_brevis/1393_a1569_4147.p1 GENE.gnl/Dysnectes_brevis/1393_a1569_4147~~gnl/Dysnectes_brevis/1393_a1569_4147.p1  ORF type:complete len:393 (-),score=123.69 gnl/Dysnectes_brevis/1393_a1569_4147:124-1302(-)